MSYNLYEDSEAKKPTEISQSSTSSSSSRNLRESNSTPNANYNTTDENSSSSNSAEVNYEPVKGLYTMEVNYSAELSNAELQRKDSLNDNYRTDLNNSSSSQSKLQSPAPIKPILKNSSSFLVQESEKPFDYDWNKFLQETLENFDTTTLPRLTNLVNSFVETAEIYAKIIISEWGLEDNEKTIKPASVGGIAGGRKYIVQGILFKIALDTQVYGQTWMYGGKKPSNTKAMKAFSHELKGVEYYMQAPVSEIHYPLLARIDFKGFRVIAIALLPINKDTLVFGSADGGKTVLGGSEIVSNMMRDIGSHLNLRLHQVNRDGVTMASPGDIEVHLGTDGRFYMLDFARVFPPEAPPADTEKRAADPRSVFYKLLRPEFVHKYKTPLNPDAFTQWNRFEENKVQHEQDLVEATNYLRTTLIPQIAAKLSTEITPLVPTKKEKVIPIKTSISDSLKWTTELLKKVHNNGINYRYLGYLRNNVQNNPALSKLILEICIARVIKHKISSQMRTVMDRVKIPADEPFKIVIADYLNFLLADDTDTTTKNYWNQTLKKNLNKCFENILTPTESNNAYSLRNAVNVPFIVQYCLNLLCVRVRASPWENFLNHTKDFKWLATDIDRLDSCTTYTFQSYLYDGTTRFLESRMSKYEDISVRLLSDTAEILELCAHKMFNCPVTHWMLANAYSELGRLTQDINKSTEYYEKSYKNYEMACNVSGNSFKAALNNYAATLLDHSRKYEVAGKKSLSKTKRAEAAEKHNQLKSLSSNISFLEYVGELFMKEIDFTVPDCSHRCLMSRILGKNRKLEYEGKKYTPCIEGRCKEAWDKHKKVFL